MLFAEDSRTPVRELFATIRELVRELRKRTRTPVTQRTEFYPRSEHCCVWFCAGKSAFRKSGAQAHLTGGQGDENDPLALREKSQLHAVRAIFWLLYQSLTKQLSVPMLARVSGSKCKEAVFGRLYLQGWKKVASFFSKTPKASFPAEQLSEIYCKQVEFPHKTPVPFCSPMRTFMVNTNSQKSPLNGYACHAPLRLTEQLSVPVLARNVLGSEC